MSAVQRKASPDMLALIRDLCAIRTAVVADGNEALFARIGRELPLEISRYRSGDKFNGWVVPDNWRVKRAKIFRDGKEVFDATDNSLGVGYYSKSFTGELGWAELAPSWSPIPTFPRPSCSIACGNTGPGMPIGGSACPIVSSATSAPGRYRVELETEREPGEMLVGHSHKKGRSGKTIVFNTNSCHPHMANDGFCGTTLLIRLMQWLAERDTYYSYRLVVGPEHLGSVFYLRDLPKAEVDTMVGGVFLEMAGTQGPMKAASTFSGGHMLDRAFAHSLRQSGLPHVLVPWRKGAGNDETVWEAPGYEVPFVEFTRCEEQFAPFREYHSSLDSPDIMDPARAR